ncbi:MAG: hypothetical protein KKD28_03595 [Chloroflexi bacterium]|nr:hypothetical protein [Chloroflexota bacterium]MBU1660539.1 hypothetical protein [Chloroflexota bacterium]
MNDEIEKELDQAFPCGDFVARSGRLRHIIPAGGSILKRAFESRLVGQAPRDEPADELLKIIRDNKA